MHKQIHLAWPDSQWSTAYLTTPDKLRGDESIVCQSHLPPLLHPHKHTFHVKLAAVQGHVRTLHLCTHLNVSTEKEEHHLSKLHSTSDTHSKIHTVGAAAEASKAAQSYYYKLILNFVMSQWQYSGWMHGWAWMSAHAEHGAVACTWLSYWTSGHRKCLKAYS